MSTRARKPPKPIHVRVDVAAALEIVDRFADKASAAATARWMGRVKPERLLRHILRLRRWHLMWMEEIYFYYECGYGVTGQESRRRIRAEALYFVLCDEAEAHGIELPWINCSEAEANAWFKAEHDQIRAEMKWKGERGQMTLEAAHALHMAGVAREEVERRARRLAPEAKDGHADPA